MEDIESALREVSDLISLPEVYLSVQRLMADPSSDIYDFAEVISVDPNLAARVLRVVNSAYFGFPEPVESIPRAVNMIGIGQLHNMVLGVSAVSSLALPNDVLPLDAFWRNSLFTGVLARLLGQKMKLRKSERLFIAGLLHDIGHLVLYAKLPEQTLAAEQLARDQSVPVHEAQVQRLGRHYGDVGAMLMTTWKLPETLGTLARYHVEPEAAGELATEARLIRLARLSAAREAKDAADAADSSLNAEIQAVTELSPQEIEDALEQARSTSADMEKVILG